MAAPTISTRVTPTGWKMPDGFKALVTFQTQTGINLWEREVKPAGVDGGEPINTTTMHNSVWRTFAARKLKTMMPVTFNCAYDPEAYSVILTQINLEQSITVTFSDGSKMAIWGFLQKFEPQELKEGEFPMASCTIQPTNWDPANRVEAGPAFSGSPGT